MYKSGEDTGDWKWGKWSKVFLFHLSYSSFYEGIMCDNCVITNGKECKTNYY